MIAKRNAGGMKGWRKKTVKILAIGLIIIFSASGAFADIYRYIDENGVMHFTNAPTSSRNLNCSCGKAASLYLPGIIVKNMMM